MRDAYIVTALRTPVGKALKGSLRDTRPDELAALVIKEVVSRSGINPEEIDDVIFGCAFPESEQGMNVARIALLRAGLPVEVPGMVVNRFCASGLQAIAIAAHRIIVGEADAIIAGGVESMSRVPMGGFRSSPNPKLMSTYPEVYLAMGLTAEILAERYGITREEQDKFGYESHMKAANAIKNGKFDSEVVPVKTRIVVKHNGQQQTKDIILNIDEGVRFDTTLEKMSQLPPVFKEGGTITAGNSSQMSDGAAALLVVSENKAKSLGLEPMAMFRGYAVAGVSPEVMGIGPVDAIPKVLKLTTLSLSEVDLIELNEAFAAQSLAVIKQLNLPYERVNVNGGAIALGHPLGCTGAKLTVTLLHEMIRSDLSIGLVTMCIGGGMGAAGIFERK